MELTQHNFTDLTIAGYNLVQGILSILHELVHSDNDDVCLTAASALGVLSHPSSQVPLFRAMEARPDLLEKLVDTAARFRTPAMLRRFSDLLWVDVPDELKSHILNLLGDFNEADVMSIYSQFVNSPSAKLREGVARGLGHQKSAAAEAETLLEKLLKDDNRDVVTQALVSLRNVGNENTVNVIEETLENYRDPYVRSAALGTLGVLSMGASRQLITKFLKDTDARIRSSAVEALGHHLASDPEALRELMPFLKDENNRVRANAIIALYGYAREESLQALHTLLQSPRKYYRASAAFCIGEIQYPEIMDKVLPLINTEPEHEVFQRALDAVGKITKSSLKPFLMRLASHPNNALRCRVIETLLNLSTVDDHYTFNELLRAEQVPEVKAALIRAIGKYSTVDNFAPLLEYLRHKNSEIVRAALDALAMVQQASAIPLVAPLVHHQDATVRASAAQTLFLLGETAMALELEKQLKDRDTTFVKSAMVATEKIFHTIRDLREEKPLLLLKALEAHFSALQESDIEQIKRGLATAAVGNMAELSRDRSTTSETQLAQLLKEILPLNVGTPNSKLSNFAKQNPKDYLAAYLDAIYNSPAGQRNLPPELIERFRQEHFLPGLFVALEQMKRGGDVRNLISHYLEMASVEIRILLEFINRAMRYVSDQNDRKALKMLDFLFHYLRLSPDIHNRFGSFYLVQKDYDLAFNHLQKAYSQAPMNFDLLLKLSGSATRLGKLAVGEILATTVQEASQPGSPIRTRAEGMLAIIAELRKGVNPDRRPVPSAPAAQEPSRVPEVTAPPPRTIPTLEEVEAEKIAEKPSGELDSVLDSVFNAPEEAPDIELAVEPVNEPAVPVAPNNEPVVPVAPSAEDEDDVPDIDELVAAVSDGPLPVDDDDDPLDIDKALADLEDD